LTRKQIATQDLPQPEAEPNEAEYAREDLLRCVPKS
jgi:hypothetical protein